MSIYVVEFENKSSAKLFSLEHVCSACTTVNKTSLGTGGEAGPSGKHTLDLPLFKKPGWEYKLAQSFGESGSAY